MTSYRNKYQLTKQLVYVAVVLGLFAQGAAIPSALADGYVYDPANSYSIYMPEEPRNLNTIHQNNIYKARINVRIGSNLLTFDADERLLPDLATYWTLSKDQKTYTFTLDPNAYFHNGAPVTSTDVKATLTLVENADEQDSEITRLANVVGVLDYRRGITEDIVGIKIIDDKTFSISLVEPSLDFLGILARNPAFIILNHQHIKQGQYIDKETTEVPIMAGDFKVIQWDRGKQMILERNAIGQTEKHRIKYIRFLFDNHPEVIDRSEEELFLDGIVDHIKVTPDMKRLIKHIKTHRDTYIIDTNELQIRYFLFPMNRPPFNNIYFRKALNYIYDNDVVLSENKDDIGERKTPIYTTLFPLIPGYNRNNKPYSYDSTKAQEMLHKSGYSDLASIPVIRIPSLQSNNRGDKKRVENVLSTQLKNFGLKTQIIYYDDWPAYRQAIVDGEVDIAPLLYKLTNNNIHYFYNNVFTSHGDFNLSGGYNDPQLELLIDQLAKARSIQARVEQTKQVEQHISDKAYIIPRYAPKHAFAFNDRAIDVSPITIQW